MWVGEWGAESAAEPIFVSSRFVPESELSSWGWKAHKPMTMHNQVDQRARNWAVFVFILGVMSTLVVAWGFLNSIIEQQAGPTKIESVMTPGMTVRATTPVGTIEIKATDALTRSYTWEGATRSVEMWP